MLDTNAKERMGIPATEGAYSPLSGKLNDLCRILAIGSTLLVGCGGNENAIRRSEIRGGAAGATTSVSNTGGFQTKLSSVMPSNVAQSGGNAPTQAVSCPPCGSEDECQCVDPTTQAHPHDSNPDSTGGANQVSATGGTVTSASGGATGGAMTSGGTAGNTVISGGAATSGDTNGNTVTSSGATGNTVTSGGAMTSGGTTGNTVISASGGATGGAMTSGGAVTGGKTGNTVTSGGAVTSGGTTSSNSGAGGSSTAPPLCSPACEGGHASWECVAGTCKITACESGYQDCDSTVLGCETNVQSSKDHCGSCSKACTGGNAEWACEQGQCAVKKCSLGWADCSTSVPGCELSASRDPNNCGACNNACSLKVCRDSNCLNHKVSAGNTGPGMGYFNFGKNYLVGERIKIDTASVLIGFGIVLNSTALDVQAYVGVYEDALNTPGKLLAGGQSPVRLGSGGAEFETDQVDLLPGNYYWLLVVTNETAMFTYNSPTTKSGNTRYVSYAFQTLPASAPAAMAVPNTPDPNFYLIVAQ